MVAVLSAFHDDFFNPEPSGSLGDGGSDGLAERSTICYACFGSRGRHDSERDTRSKLEGDFTRARTSYPSFNTWRFITNVRTGPECGAALAAIQQEHGPDTERPITAAVWKPQDLWTRVVSRLPLEDLNNIFPGAPGVSNVELEDMVPLLETLSTHQLGLDVGSGIRPVPVLKMDYNAVPEVNRIEFNEGRRHADRIDDWYRAQSDPEAYDRNASAFREIYSGHRQVAERPGDLLERVYISLGGANFRLDGSRANAVYAVSSYFFDACHIFEEPPQSYRVGDPSAFAD